MRQAGAPLGSPPARLPSACQTDKTILLETNRTLPSPNETFTPPAQNLGPHVAALGMRFYTGTQFPARYRDQIFIAEHGSWNRSNKIGYRVTLVRVEGNKPVAYEPFATGWLEGEKSWGRPADVLVTPDGALLVSDDLAGAIYRITYRG